MHASKIPYMELSEKEFRTKLGLHIRDLRMKKKIKLEKLAFENDIPKSTLSRIENGVVTPSIYSLYRLSNALEVSLVKMIDIL